MSQMPTPVFTDEECLALIKRRDKNIDDDYSKQYLKDVEHITPPKSKPTK